MKKLFLFIFLLIFGLSAGMLIKEGGFNQLSLVCAIIAAASLISCAIVVASLKEN
ncbi:MAG: hypothetical protein ACO1N0_06175 [Fluviicola sp.]